MAKATQTRQEKNATTQDIPLAEWIVGGIGLCIVLATVGYLLLNALGGDRSPPNIHVQVESITPLRNGFLVQFLAQNDGSQTASEVTIEGTHSAGDENEESSATLDFLPPRSKRRGGLLFQRDPRGTNLALRASGYREP